MTKVFYDNLEREREFMEKLGQAVAEWGSVEGTAYGIYSFFMRGSDSKLISVNFFQIHSFSSRISLLDRCAYFAIQDEAIKLRWKKLRNRILSHADSRNQIVHSSYIIEGKGEVLTPTLGPSHMDATAITRGRAMNSEYRIDARKLARMRYDFGRLAHDMQQFLDDLKAITS